MRPRGAFARPPLEALGLVPDARRADPAQPGFELGAITRERLGQYARVAAQRIGHAFAEPHRLEERVAHAAEALVLQNVDQLVAHEVRPPSAVADGDAEGADRIRAPRAETELRRALRRRAEHRAPRRLQRADRAFDEAQ